MPRPHALLLVLATLATPAPAAIYKCQEAGGGTSYQQTPCPGPGGEAAIHNQSPSREEEQAAHQRGQRDMKAAEDLERQQEARRREAGRQAEERRAARREAAARCAKYLEEADSLTRYGRSKAHERQAEQLRNRHFSECYSEGR